MRGLKNDLSIAVILYGTVSSIIIDLYYMGEGGVTAHLIPEMHPFRCEAMGK